MMTVVGMFVGVLVTGVAFPTLHGFADSTSLGTRTLPQIMHLSYGAVVFLVVVVALIVFRCAEWVERRHLATGNAP